MDTKITQAPLPRAAADTSGKQYIPEPYKEMAKGMERQFAEFMVQEMQKTIGESDVSSGMDYYKSLLTSEYAEAMAQNKSGLGIQDVILDQVYPQNKRSEIAYNHYKQQEALAQAGRPTFIRLKEDNPTEGDIEMAIKNALESKGVNHE